MMPISLRTLLPARLLPALLVLLLAPASPLTAEEATSPPLDKAFATGVQPFLRKYCLDCHGQEEPEAKLDLSRFGTFDSVVRDIAHWNIVLDRVAAGEMPPEEAEAQPTGAERRAVVDWITRLRRREAERNAGDPGLVLARRLSNAEYDYTILDLTGVDIRPTREFPVDPGNEAGFANSGESLAMTPALLKKYLDAARHVADHLVLSPTGVAFAPHPVTTDSDRDKYSVRRVVDFYQRQPVDLAEYFFAAWRLRHEAGDDTERILAKIASEEGVSAKYLETVWQVLSDGKQHAGPLAQLREMWQDLPTPAGESQSAARKGCAAMREFVLEKRRELVPPIDKSTVARLNSRLQPAILWINRQMAANRRKGRFPDAESPSDEEIAAVARFCSVFPDAFFVSERGRTFLDPRDQNKGRLLSAGFHLMVGYFRDDAPLYDLVLDEAGRRELDALWRELNFITRAPMRQFRDFIYFERAESTRYLTGPEFDFARSEDDDVTSPAKMRRVAELFVAKAEREGIPQPALEVLDQYFRQIDAQVRRVEEDLAAAEPRHVEAVLELAERAWRRPLTSEEQGELRSFYEGLRDEEQLPHEEALRDVVVSILMSPRFSYRIDPAPPGDKIQPLSNDALASRLSYFLWSSMPDKELLARAAAGDLQRPEVIAAQARRMLADPRVRRLALEFGGNWLDFRQFQQHNAVDRRRFPEFTDELRQAMFEEPVRFFEDLIHRDGSVLDLLEADHTFVNGVLAEHYDIPASGAAAGDWVRIDDARQFGRGGLLPMSVFLTKNSPGLRTSPVKRGYWVARRLLGEHIPAPPADVPELPEDEAKLGELSLREVLARHRAVKSCAACHQRFDSIGLVFEGYGPVGERRERDLGGRSVDDQAEFPDGSRGRGLDGLQSYLRRERTADFLDNLCRKLLAYALGRSLLLSDEATLRKMRAELETGDHRFSRLVETIVTSPQFLNRRGRDYEPLAP